MSAIQIHQIKSFFEKPENYRYKKEVQKFLTDYKDNYAIDYNVVQKLASTFKVKQVLLISCNMDAQNYITRRTAWDALNIPGATVIDPAYRLSTQITLIDANNQSTLWSHNYQKLISSRENRIIPTSYNDAAEQLEKVNKYSTKFLAPQVVQETQLALLKISPYQNLNVLHPEVVKPNAISIDKMKIDSQRGMVKSGRLIKKQSIAAGTSIAAGSVKLAKNSSKAVKKSFFKVKNTVKKPDLLNNKSSDISIEEQIEQMKQEEQAKLELKQAKQQIKFEKQIQKQQLNAAKKQAKAESKAKLEEQKRELTEKYSSEKTNIETKQNENLYDINNKTQTKQSFLQRINIFKKKKKEIQNAEEPQVIETPVEEVTQPDIRTIPYIRTKPTLRETDYTINDY